MKNEQEILCEKLNEENTLKEVQEYIKQAIHLRGFDSQDVEKTMLLLTEEIGELAKAIRKDATDMSTDKNKLYSYDTIESEVADVFIVLTCICNKLNINLFDAVYNKEKENVKRNWNKEGE